MPLLVDQLALWSIGFQWAGLDPDRLWLRIPRAAKDNFSTLLEAILQDHLACVSLQAEKYTGSDREEAQFHIRFWLDDVYAGIWGRHYNRRLLRHAVVERGDFKDWCERRTIPLPEFWFPPGWTEYRWPGEDEVDSAAQGQSSNGVNSRLSAQPSEAEAEAKEPDAPAKERDSHKARHACQVIARVIWKDAPEMTIAAMCKDERILRYGDAQRYNQMTVRRWIQEVAPAEVSSRKGRPRKKTPTEE